MQMSFRLLDNEHDAFVKRASVGVGESHRQNLLFTGAHLLEGSGLIPLGGLEAKGMEEVDRVVGLEIDLELVGHGANEPGELRLQLLNEVRKLGDLTKSLF